jgi:16S rRNA (uracil1498-N3)-methyltransferase
MRTAVALERVFDDSAWRDAAVRYALDDRATNDASPPWPARDRRGAVEVVFAVGPEGGWSDAERALLQRQGARGLRLGGRVLRAETAVLVGLTVLQYELGDLSNGPRS